MNYITEFVPDQLIVVKDIHDLPDEYVKLLKKWLKLKYGYRGDDIEEVWQSGDEIKIIHWEWKYKDDYYLIVAISGWCDAEESGAVFLDGEPIFEIDSVLLRPLNTKSILYSRINSFEHLRLMECQDHEHCNYCYDIYKELENELESESVSEEEFKKALNDKYVHYSSDDASDID